MGPRGPSARQATAGGGSGGADLSACWPRPEASLAAASFAGGLIPSRPLLVGEASPRGDTAQALSEENVEIVERAVAAVNERDIDAYLACVTEDIEISTPIADFGGVYEGPDGIRRFFADPADTVAPTSESALFVWS